MLGHSSTIRPLVTLSYQGFQGQLCKLGVKHFVKAE